MLSYKYLLNIIYVASMEKFMEPFGRNLFSACIVLNLVKIARRFYENSDWDPLGIDEIMEGFCILVK